MAKLVILSQGLIGRAHELKVDKTTIGRVDDNTFPIPEASVSSHHCEITLQGSNYVVTDLNSTNGTFINGDKITGEATLKPGQILRLGQVEMRLEVDGAAPAPAPAPTASAASKRPGENTTVMQRGVSLTDLEKGARNVESSSKGFTKKDNKGNKIFLIAMVVVAVIIIGLVVYALMSAGS